MKYATKKMLIEATKIADLLLSNDRTLYCQVTLLITRISNDSRKEHRDIINGEYEDNYFLMNPT